MKQPVQRRLAAILAADVAGYSRLMGADEEGTHERLKAHLRELVDPKIKEHRGRTVKNTGDGLLRAEPLTGSGPRRQCLPGVAPHSLSPSRRDREFESVFLQQTVRCPDRRHR
jgi:hypothetical protein